MLFRCCDSVTLWHCCYTVQMKFHWQHETWWYDLDGTFTGNAGHKVTPWNELLPHTGCTNVTTVKSGWNMGVMAAICDETVDWIRWAFNEPQPPSLMVKCISFRTCNISGNPACNILCFYLPQLLCLVCSFLCLN